MTLVEELSELVDDVRDEAGRAAEHAADLAARALDRYSLDAIRGLRRHRPIIAGRSVAIFDELLAASRPFGSLMNLATAQLGLGEVGPARASLARGLRHAEELESPILLATALLTEVDVANPGAVLLPGMYARVHLHLSGGTPPLVIPASALVVRQGGPQVMVVDAPAGGAAGSPWPRRRISCCSSSSCPRGAPGSGCRARAPTRAGPRRSRRACTT